MIALDDEQKKAVEDPSRIVAILASAGSGKTRTLVARIVHSIRDEGVDPSEIVAFTFTERAADELRSRILQELADIGPRISKMFVGTIHSFCFRFLIQNEAFINFEPLDEINIEALVYRIYDALGLDRVYGGSFSANLERFLRDYDLYENELLEIQSVPTDIREAISEFSEMLLRNRLFSFGSMIRYAIEHISSNKEKSSLKHLFIDEFQDVNPAQLKLAEAMIGESAKLTVVGDDLQSIYQWRGSDVSLLLSFKKLFPYASLHFLRTNYRSRPQIVQVAETFSKTISPRFDKEIVPFRPEYDNEGNYFQECPSEADQAVLVGKLVSLLGRRGYRWRDIAILLRSAKTSASPILRVLKDRGVPFFCPQVNIEGTIISEVFVPLFRLLTARKEPRNEEEEAESDKTVEKFLNGTKQFFAPDMKHLSRLVDRWRADIQRNKAQAYNVRSYLYDFFAALNLKLSEKDVDSLPQLGTVTQIVRSVEEIHRRNIIGHEKRPSAKEVYREISYMLETRSDQFGETNMMMAAANAVIVTTVHQAKGLEWPVVILPSVINGRFPVRSRKHETSFSDSIAERYGTSETDERRLFYVAMTRAMEALIILGFQQKKPNTSRFVQELLKTGDIRRTDLYGISGDVFPEPPQLTFKEEVLSISLSDFLMFHECPFEYHLRRNSGIYPPIQDDLGFGRSLHEIIQRRSREPGDVTLSELVDRFTHIPFESRLRLEAHKKAIHRRVQSIASLGLLGNQMQSEIDIAIRIRNATILGKVDGIAKDTESNKSVIYDWKSSLRKEFIDRYSTQVQVYALGLKNSGTPISKAYIIDVKDTFEQNKPKSIEVDVSDGELNRTAEMLEKDLERLMSFDFSPRPSALTCSACDVSTICSFSERAEGGKLIDFSN